MRTSKPAATALTALFNTTCIRLLSLLYTHPGKSFYLREIARTIGRGTGTVQRELATLVSAGLVVRRASGNQVYYGANTQSHVYNEIRGLIIKTFGLADILREALHPLSSTIDCALIYGSQADGTAAAESDIDLLVVGRVGEIALHKAIGTAERTLGKDVHYSLLTVEEFRKRKKEKKGFVARLIAGGKIMLIGDVNEV
ncbi:MAG: MarR family transcriptional regulator [Deltaproteobacteria bacterium]|nr:MarR family transcriptional regulator [Deltaproteobacteria bacterium]